MKSNIQLQIVRQRDPHRHTDAAQQASANARQRCPRQGGSMIVPLSEEKRTPERATTPAPATKRGPHPSTTTLPLFAQNHAPLRPRP